MRMPCAPARTLVSWLGRDRRASVLRLGHRIQPVDGPPFDRLLDRDVSHRARRGGAVPVFDPWRNPHHIAHFDTLRRTSPLLNPAGAGGDDQNLSLRMAVP